MTLVHSDLPDRERARGHEAGEQRLPVATAGTGYHPSETP